MLFCIKIDLDCSGILALSTFDTKRRCKVVIGFPKNDKRFNKKVEPAAIYLLYLIPVILAIFSLGAIYYLLACSKIEKFSAILCTGVFIVNLIVTGIVIYFNNIYLKQQISLSQKEENYQQLQVYSGIIEDLSKNLRKQKHDYNNVLISVGRYLNDNDYEGLRKFFFNEIIPANENYSSSKENLLALNKIENPGLRGLLISKISSVADAGINIHIDIYDKIDEFHMETCDLCRIIGIFVDNAIEASCLAEKKIVIISVFLENGVIHIMIGNSFDHKFEINSIFTEGYSTKGAGRGIGLKTVKEILRKKYTNILLDTYIDNDLLVQEMKISKRSTS